MVVHYFMLTNLTTHVQVLGQEWKQQQLCHTPLAPRSSWLQQGS